MTPRSVRRGFLISTPPTPLSLVIDYHQSPPRGRDLTHLQLTYLFKQLIYLMPPSNYAPAGWPGSVFGLLLLPSKETHVFTRRQRRFAIARSVLKAYNILTCMHAGLRCRMVFQWKTYRSRVPIASILDVEHSKRGLRRTKEGHH